MPVLSRRLTYGSEVPCKGDAPVSQKSEKRATREVKDPLRGCLQTLFDLFRILGYASNGDERSFLTTLAHWKLGSEKIGWMKFVKYKLAAFFSAQMRQDLPTRPEGLPTGDSPLHLVCGRAGRWLSGQMRLKDRPKVLGILASIKLTKKGMPRPSDVEIEKAIQSTIQKLSHPPLGELSWAEITEVEDTAADMLKLPVSVIQRNLRFSKQDLQKEIARTVHEIFDGCEYTYEDRVRPFFPSTSSNYVSSRSGGGAVGYIVGDRNLLSGLENPGGALRLEPCVEAIDEAEKVSTMTHLRGRGFLKLVGVGDLEDRFSKLWFRLLKRASLEEFYVEPVGLAEALKVRVITKGNAAAQTVMKSMQKFMFKHLCKLPTFRSLEVGGQLTAKFLQEQLGLLKAGCKWLSGDYEAATDNLQSWASEVVITTLCKILRISGKEEDILLRLLTGHVIPTDDGLLKQRTGQLMGSIVSFPVLCIINAALCRLIVEEDRSFISDRFYREQRLSLQQAQMLINGDDLVLKCSPFGRWLWHVIGEKVLGLKESVGKTYYSAEFIEMNSRLFHYKDDDFVDVDDHKERCPAFRQVPLVNMGLVAGMVRSSATSNTSVPVVQTSGQMSWGGRMRMLHREMTCVGGFNGECWARAKSIVVRRNSSLFLKTTCPWYLPESLGGLGIPGIPTPRDISLSLAATKLGLKFTSRVDPTWLVWQLVAKKIEEVGSGLQQHLTPVDRTVRDRAVAQLVVNCLFDTNVSQKLMRSVKTEEAHAHKAYNRNQKIWSRLNSGKYGFPGLRGLKKYLGFEGCSDSDVEFRKECGLFLATLEKFRDQPEIPFSGDFLRYD